MSTEKIIEKKPWDPGLTRRTFLKLMGAQLAMLSMAGCVKPLENIVPYVRAPEDIVPGKPLYFASAITLGGFARGVLVETNMGRPTKIEGNPEHPDSLGATDAATQAVIYQLYDPVRSKTVMHESMPSSWQRFAGVLRSRCKQLKTTGGEGLCFLSQPIISPTLAFLRTNILKEFPKAIWHQYSVLNRDRERKASLKLYGKDVQPVLQVKNADVIFSIESDFLTQGPGAVAYSREFGQRRSVESGTMRLNRFYALEATPTLTGASADHRMVCRPHEIETFMGALVETVEKGHSDIGQTLAENTRNFLEALARDLVNNISRSLVIAGREQNESVQIAAFRLNNMLHNVGKTIEYIQPVEEISEDSSGSIIDLARELENKTVSDLIIIDGDPVYATPRNLDFAKRLRSVGNIVYLGSYYDDTAKRAHWHIPLAHEFESWGDVRAFDGSVTIRQPLIRPLYNGVTEYELCLLLLGEETNPYDEVIRSYWKERLHISDFDSYWHKTLHDGIMADSAFKPLSVTERTIPSSAVSQSTDRKWTLLIRQDPYILDGRFSNNSWLRELPRPLSKLSWENAAYMSPQSAQQKGLTDGTVIEISAHGEVVYAPVYLLPGQAPETITVFLGYGRKIDGGIGDSIGFDAYKLQSDNEPFSTTDFSFKRTMKPYQLAITQTESREGGRDLALVTDVDSYKKNPALITQNIITPKKSETLYIPEQHLNAPYQWGMIIDLSRCTGCGACTMACQVENNGSVVGITEVKRGRIMHWIRVDRYFKGSGQEPDIIHQPVPCMHCENAPCELVCPVEATSHSEEGINEMTYNRCVGTRFCSNNCPYKVRRFNFFDYNFNA
ncbi:MAG: 4Fe-4S dicluster domain-containing protein [Endomicrobiales bacterium]